MRSHVTLSSNSCSVSTTTIMAEPEADGYEIFASALEVLYDEVPATLATTGGVYIHEQLGRKTITIRTPETCSENWGLQADGVWQAARYLADNLLPDLKGKRVLELGAAAGLPGIVAIGHGPRSVVLSDYPDPGILKRLEENVKANWEDHGVDIKALEELGGERFDVVMAADVLWKQEMHEALCRTLDQALVLEDGGRVHIVAGLHTGRAVIAGFVELVLAAKFEVDEIYEVSVGTTPRRREWAAERAGETMGERRLYVHVESD
ncbi:methyltransferase domain protein [Ceratobasidium sp. AG-Ba]|nr:methyltransferase domain protein [Ceratobasidium sp. AG-Ba]QRW03957.1 methyltransferase domain protein [Ceratobasidium sp. AG-Ba]